MKHIRIFCQDYRGGGLLLQSIDLPYLSPPTVFLQGGNAFACNAQGEDGRSLATDNNKVLQRELQNKLYLVHWRMSIFHVIDAGNKGKLGSSFSPDLYLE